MLDRLRNKLGLRWLDNENEKATTEVEVVQTRANKSGTPGSLRDIVWKNRDTTIDGKMRIYETCIK